MSEPVFFVHPKSDPVVILVRGRAVFAQCGPLDDALHGLVEKGSRNFLFDFSGCEAMDSTFMGIIAGLALDMTKQFPPGVVMLNRLAGDNLATARTLGLLRLVQVTDLVPAAMDVQAIEKGVPKGMADRARMMLAAHESLVAADAANAERFRDVISMVRQQVEKDSSQPPQP